ncbi:hypothetical protein [Castellaniella sp.]|uniref:hypothetical protein n=1 Tax=Castellaniella sp. TaxID=1955812 RepID=UPI002AFF37BE|nr:hypothetical protein [Castellaniella sp.]
MTEETAVQLIAGMAEKLGVEIDAAEELEQARAAQQKQREDDVFRQPPAAEVEAPAAMEEVPPAATARADG